MASLYVYILLQILFDVGDYFLCDVVSSWPYRPYLETLVLIGQRYETVSTVRKSPRLKRVRTDLVGLFYQRTPSEDAMLEAVPFQTCLFVPGLGVVADILASPSQLGIFSFTFDTDKATTTETSVC